MPEIPSEDHLLNVAIQHANRASELVREGMVELAYQHDQIADTFRGLAHELRVGKSKRKYSEVRVDVQLPYPMPPKTITVEFDPATGMPRSGVFMSGSAGGNATFGISIDDAVEGEEVDVILNDDITPDGVPEEGTETEDDPETDD